MRKYISILMSFLMSLSKLVPLEASINKDPKKSKVIVIGAGLAGLTAAYRLYQKGYDVHVYEARNRVGGRVHSILMQNFDGEYSIGELGGQNIADGGETKFLISLAKELDIEIIERTVESS